MAALIHRLRIAVNTVTACCLGFMVFYCLQHIFRQEKEQAVIHQEVQKVQESKPDEDENILVPLRKMNPDSIGWLEINDTEIDQPVVQGKDNYEYLQKNIYGEYAMSGSLFMDVRCDRSFSSFYQLIYGHHMSEHMMLADLDKYLDDRFFLEKGKGILTTEKGEYELIPLAVLRVDYDDPWIFYPLRCNEDPKGFLAYVRDTALYQKDVSGKNLLAVSTCSTRAKNERVVVLYSFEE